MPRSVLHILFKADALLIDFCCGFRSDIAVMPDFFGDAGQPGLITWIPEDKSVFVTVFLKPQVYIISRAVDIDGESELMLAAAGQSGILSRQFQSFRVGITLSAVFFYFVVIDALLIVESPVTGHDDRSLPPSLLLLRPQAFP